MTQVAKLFIRGSLMKQIAKNLTRLEAMAVENLVNRVWIDPEIQNGKFEFALALQRTIRNEYKQDMDICLQEAWVTFWRAAVDVLYGKHKTDARYWSTQRVVNCPSIACDCSPRQPLCRKKIFQTWLYNYLRQILRENVRPTHKARVALEGRCDLVLLDLVKITIENVDPNLGFTIVHTDEHTHVLTLDRPLLPPKLKIRLDKLMLKYERMGLSTVSAGDTITVHAAHAFSLKSAIIRERRVQTVSISCGTDDDDDSAQIDPNQIGHKHGGHMQNDVVSHDLLQTISQRLTPQARKVFEVITNPPLEFTPDHKGPIHKRDIAEYLGMTKQELLDAYEVIRNQCIAIGHVPQD